MQTSLIRAEPSPFHPVRTDCRVAFDQLEPVTQGGSGPGANDWVKPIQLRFPTGLIIEAPTPLRAALARLAPSYSKLGQQKMKIPLSVPNLAGRESEYLQECITSTFISSVGPFVTRFEDDIAQVSGVEQAAVLCSGTAALHMTLLALGIGAGDLVLAPSLTFIATPNAIRHSGADVWITDVSPDDWAMDFDLVRRLLLEETDPCPQGRRHRASGKTVRALMPVMIMGTVPDLEAASALAKEFGLFLVLDAAAAIGTTYGSDIPLGRTGADAVCYSFNGNKTITCGGGGAVAAANNALVERIRHLSSTARVGAHYDHDEVGYNYRMTNLQAAVGVAQLERLDAFLETKRHCFEAYCALADRFDSLGAFPDPPYGQNGHWFSGVWYRGTDPSCAPAFIAYLQDKGIDLRPFWKPVHLQTPYRTSLATPCPVSEDLWTRIFPLPCSTHITPEELSFVVDQAAAFWEGRKHDGSAQSAPRKGPRS